MSAARSKHRRPIPETPQAPTSASLFHRTPLALPLCLTILLFALSFMPRVHATPILSLSFFGAVAALLLWQGALQFSLKRHQRTPLLATTLRSQHYVQALVQLSVFAYWGWYWRPVYDHATLLLAQVAFAYIFDMLLTWSRRETYALGFGPFPIIFSTNLFLWFRDDWFYLQFLMIAVGFLGKEFIRWNRDGRRVHIFNPSAFSLGLFSLVLLSTGTTSISWAEEIATTLTLAPSIYLFLFLAGLVVMYAFSITLVAASAAAVLFGFSSVYTATTGVPYFIDSVNISADTHWKNGLRPPVRHHRLRSLHGPRWIRRSNVLRQTAIRASAQSERSSHRPPRPNTAHTSNVRAFCSGPGSTNRESGAYRGLDCFLYADGTDRRNGWSASRRQRPVLGRRVRQRSPTGL